MLSIGILLGNGLRRRWGEIVPSLWRSPPAGERGRMGLAGLIANVEIIAHRGASQEAPENTLAAIRHAWQQNADAVEVDVHLSKDGQVVVIHDSNTHQARGGK